ncbi:L,D-transpeptidase family protein [Prosthecobacter sp.]|uniref:L,D-transpeptidase family protein n=1 Tax=Prosthecobacter sp. TaxID=1965333 RepID=UPI002ABD0B8B|nr:L,D-transpeptidase family protein [Prosthecobacter sp.]MDZ4403492.1 L,D-transpeptidase family protein [Prosthecobacter sp.]
MTFARSLALSLAAAVVVLSSCATAPQANLPPVDNRAWWKGDGVVGPPRIVINLSEQRIHYFKGGELVGMSPISSGKESTGTVNGRFSIIEKDLHHRSSLFGSYIDSSGDTVVSDVDTRKDPQPPGTKFVGANMRYFMRIVGGIGMHEGYLPGYPASHGCIRLPTKMAAIFYRETPHGTPVQIIGHGSFAANEEPIQIGSDEIDIAPAPSAPPARVVAAASPAKAAPATPAARSVTHTPPARTTLFASSKPQKKESKPRQTETIRRAIVPMKKRISRMRPGETLFIE